MVNSGEANNLHGPCQQLMVYFNDSVKYLDASFLFNVSYDLRSGKSNLVPLDLQ